MCVKTIYLAQLHLVNAVLGLDFSHQRCVYFAAVLFSLQQRHPQLLYVAQHISLLSFLSVWLSEGWWWWHVQHYPAYHCCDKYGQRQSSVHRPLYWPLSPPLPWKSLCWIRPHQPPAQTEIFHAGLAIIFSRKYLENRCKSPYRARTKMNEKRRSE